MVITDIRFSFIETETLADVLADVKPAVIPYAFLLGQASYQSALANAIAAKGNRTLPWQDDFGKLFWYYYLQRKSDFSITSKEAWLGLVPLQEPPMGTAVAPWLPAGEIEIRPYVYPWGVAAVIDVHAWGEWSIEEAVALGLQVRDTGRFDWTTGGKTVPLSMNALMSSVLGLLRAQAFGAMTGAQSAGMFSVATVQDARDAVSDAPIEDQSTLHRALYALSSWSPLWNDAKKKIDAIHDRRIHTKPSVTATAHVVYGTARGRAVWLPAGFPSSDPKPKVNPFCYHRNLVSSALQTESLCALAESAKTILDKGQTLASQSVVYDKCTERASGILGRLHGGDTGTYRSMSVRAQMQDRFFAQVNALRKGRQHSELQLKPVNAA